MTDRGHWMQTHSGRAFYPFDPRPEDFTLEDLARGIAGEQRYAGQSKFFYSVAQHCCLIHDALFRYLFADRPRVELLELQRCGLMHDASEGLMKDIPGPMKVNPAFDFYRGREHHFQEVINRKYGLPINYHPIIKEYDLRARATERRDVMNKPPKDWTDNSTNTFDIKIEHWSPERSLNEFMQRCEELGIKEP